MKRGPAIRVVTLARAGGEGDSGLSLSRLYSGPEGFSTSWLHFAVVASLVVSTESNRIVWLGDLLGSNERSFSLNDGIVCV